MAGRLKPQQLGPNDWYYEEDDHLLLVHEVRNADGDHIRTDQIKIPWSRIENSLRRVRQTA